MVVFYRFCLRILCYIYLKYHIFFTDELRSGKSCKLQLANYKLDIKYTQTKHETFPTMSHCIKSQQMCYFTGFALCRDRKKWDISKIPFAPTNSPAERPCCFVWVNRFLLAPRIALSVYSLPQANRRNRQIVHTLKIDEGVFANISQGKNGKELVRILPNFRYIINDLQNFADFSENGSKTAIY